MICYEIWVDGKKLCVAGHSQALSLQFSLFLIKALEEPHLAVSGLIASNEKLKEEVRWIGRYVSQGSEITIKLIDSENPDKPKKCASFGSRLHPKGKKRLFCSFCGLSEDEVVRIFEGIAGNICLECVQTCYEDIIEIEKRNE